MVCGWDERGTGEGTLTLSQLVLAQLFYPLHLRAFEALKKRGSELNLCSWLCGRRLFGWNKKGRGRVSKDKGEMLTSVSRFRGSWYSHTCLNYSNIQKVQGHRDIMYDVIVSVRDHGDTAWQSTGLHYWVILVIKITALHIHTHIRTLEISHACHGQIKLKGKRNTTFPIIYNAPYYYMQAILHDKHHAISRTPASLDVYRHEEEYPITYF